MKLLLCRTAPKKKLCCHSFKPQCFRIFEMCENDSGFTLIGINKKGAVRFPPVTMEQSKALGREKSCKKNRI